ncbi:sigma-70 family RNA polymerase sigma factor [Streptomyces sp. YGL11-2]|uniref:sigma-70 family RNA polymerase sigma factor n=1 Tax=Streptomyces sp. YGL11-2 TaxID=3414028 RepID=UPI003CF05453
MGARHDEQFEQFTRGHWQQLRQTAYLLCADWHVAEDLTQTALSRCYPRWRTLHRQEAAYPYVRRTLVRCFVDHTRKHSSREQLPGEFPDVAKEETQVLEERDALTRALAALAPMQRAALVLRFWHDLDVAETARLLRRKPATIRSDTARGLERMRTLLARQEAPH